MAAWTAAIFSGFELTQLRPELCATWTNSPSGSSNCSSLGMAAAGATGSVTGAATMDTVTGVATSSGAADDTATGIAAGAADTAAGVAATGIGSAGVVAASGLAVK